MVKDMNVKEDNVFLLDVQKIMIVMGLKCVKMVNVWTILVFG